MTTRPNDDDRDLAVELLGKIYIRLDVGAEVFTMEGDPDNITAVLDLIRQIEARTYERAAGEALNKQHLLISNSVKTRRNIVAAIRALAEAAKDGAR